MGASFGSWPGEPRARAARRWGARPHVLKCCSPAALPGGGNSAVTRLTSAVDPQRHPNLAAAPDHVPAPHQEQHFEHGLDLIITGIRTGLDQLRP